MMPVLCLIQVRSNSSRIDQKMMQKIGDTPLIDWVIARIEKISFHLAIFCLPEKEKYSQLAEILRSQSKNKNFLIFYGDEDNVALRFKEAIQFSIDNKLIDSPFHVCRVCGDRPFLDKDFFDVLFYEIEDYDLLYNHNIDGRFTGFGFELMNHEAVLRTFLSNNYLKFLDKEHVTLPLYSSDQFKCKLRLPDSLKIKKHFVKGKFDLDTEQDLSYINKFVSRNSLSPDTANIYKKAIHYR